MFRRATAALAALMIIGVAGCTSASLAEEPVAPEWQEITFPSGPAGTAPSVRAITSCAGQWYATGALLTPDADPRPAAWSSPDARTWTALEVAPNTYYGERNIVYAAACDGARLVAIGAKAGGAHGNPRTSTWYLDPDGVLVEVEARPYTLFGGENAVNTSRIAAGPLGFILTGNRVSGAAAWLSPAGLGFEIIERAPGLAHADGVLTFASDVMVDRDGWLIVGARTPSGGSRDPAAWFSDDGRSWQQQSVPASADYEELQRVVRSADTVVAVGPRGNGFGAWRRTAAATWEAASAFGAIDGTVPGSAIGIAAISGGLAAVVWTGLKYEMWASYDLGTTWRDVELPVPGPSGPDSTATFAAGHGHVLVALDGGDGSRIWSWRSGEPD